MKSFFAFDLDGTVTLEETLPLLAKELKLSAEMALLTSLTMEGKIDFANSFKLRYYVLRNIPIKRIQEIMSTVRLDPSIEEFIKKNSDSCAIITGNLDIWIKPIVERLGCTSYTSVSGVGDDGLPELKSILDKGAAIRELRKKTSKLVAIGEGFNDVPMFEEADVAVAYGGVHKPVDTLIDISDYVVMEGEALCRLLKML